MKEVGQEDLPGLDLELSHAQHGPLDLLLEELVGEAGGEGGEGRAGPVELPVYPPLLGDLGWLGGARGASAIVVAHLLLEGLARLLQNPRKNGWGAVDLVGGDWIG